MPTEKNIKTPDELWKLFEDYVAHEQQNPMKKIEYVGRDGNKVETELEVPITFEGFECYLMEQEVINDLGDYASNKDGRYGEYATIINRIRKNCFSHNFKGAAVGLFNPNLIARKLGLVDRSRVDQNANVRVLNIDPLDDAG